MPPFLESVSVMAANVEGTFLSGPDTTINIPVPKANSILKVWGDFASSVGLLLGNTGRFFTPISGAEVGTGGYSGVCLWVMVNPPIGTHQLHPRFIGTVQGVAIVEHWSGVDQTTPFGAAVLNSGASTGTQNLAVPGVLGAIATAVVSDQDGPVTLAGDITPTGSTSLAFSYRLTAGYKAGAASVNFAYSGPLGNMGGVSVNPGSGSPSSQLAIIQQQRNQFTNLPADDVLTVMIQDANGFVVETDTSLVTVSLFSVLSGGDVELAGTLTRNAVLGIATFPDLTVRFRDRSQWQLRAASGILTPATSNPMKGYLIGDKTQVVMS